MTTSAHHLTLVSLLVSASLVAAPRVAGQESPAPPNVEQPALAIDSLPFRRGQWGAEFGIGDGTVGLGVLRFRSTRTAWQFSANGSADWSRSDPPHEEFSGSTLFVNLHAGPRRYRPLAPAVGAFVGTGLTAGYSWWEFSGSWRRGWNAGVYGELGGVYFVTRRLSLGALIQAGASYGEDRGASASLPTVHRERTFAIRLSPVRIVGGLYF